MLEDGLIQCQREAFFFQDYTAPEVITLENALRITLPQLKVVVSYKEPKYTASLINKFHFGKQPPEPLAEIPMEELIKYAVTISEYAFAVNTYREVLDHPDFRKLYKMKLRELTYFKNGVDGKGEFEETGACTKCALVLPWYNLTIDHQRPQDGGEIEAVLKTLRALGLTVEGPQGDKGRIIRGLMPRGRGVRPKLDRLIPLPGVDLNKRYTLNHEGTIFYTLICAARHERYLGTQCMHGLLNLRPYCNRCNSSRRDALKYGHNIKRRKRARGE